MDEKKDNSNVSTGCFPENTNIEYLQENTINHQEKMLRLENLISGLSTALIDAHEENLEKELNSWLKKFVEFLEVDRGIINEYLDYKTVQVLTYYTAPDVDVAPLEKTHRTPEGEIEEFQKGIIIRAEKIPEDLPQMLHGGLIERENTKSLIIVPLSISNRVIGCLSFASYRKNRKWPENLIRRIKLIGEIIANNIQRINSQKALSKEVNRRQALEERYSSIIKNSNLGFMIIDLSNYSIIDANDEYCRMSGYSRDELISKKISGIDASENPDKVRSEGRTAIQEGSIHHTTIHKRKDGSLFDVEISSTVFGRDDILYSFVRDITDLNQARYELEERLRFEELVSEFSASLVNIKPDDFNEELDHWLKKFVEFLEVDRGIIHEYQDDKTVQVLTCYTVLDVKAAFLEKTYRTAEGEIEEFQKGIIIRAEKIPDDLPEMLHGSIIERDNTKSLVIVPLSVSNRVIGSLTFASYRKERKWSDDLVRRIKLIGEIIANTIQRINSQQALSEEVERRKIMEERYSSILKTANVGFWISDQNQNILVVNDEYCRMSGYSREELQEIKISDIDISKDPEKIEKDGMESIFKGSYKHESKHMRKDGEIIDVEINSNFLEKEGVYFSFFRDITELNNARRDLEERLDFETLISEFSAALINVKLKHIKKEINQWIERFAKLLNVDRFTISEYQNDFKFINLLFSYTNPDIASEAMPLHSKPVETYGFYKYLRRGENIKFENPAETFPEDIKSGIIDIIKSGTKSFLLMPLRVGDNLLGTMSMSTITHEKKWTKDLERMLGLFAEIFSNTLIRDKTDFKLDNYRKRLEKMVEERTVKLEKAQKELVISEKMATLGKLTATVSHELRNPLGTIRTSIYSLQKRLEDQNPKILNALNRAERNIIRCDLIIEDLLNYSRTQALNLKPTVIDNWIDDLLGEISPPHGIIIERKLNSGATINMDQERFMRCVINILTNAYQAIQEKNGGKNGCVSVRTYPNKKNIIIDISDNGVGFDMDNVTKIYEPLYSTKTFGIGLGITITKQIIEQHGWDMEITGMPQEGASVKITIPVVVE